MSSAGADVAAPYAQRGTEAPEGVAGRLGRAVLPLALILAVFAAFLPSLGNDFVAWDDDLNFTENPRYRGLSAAHLRWMLTTLHGGHYQPISWITLGLDYVLWGMNPVGYHLTNLVIHAANAVLCYHVIRVLLARTSRARDADVRLAAAAGALFFAIHPLRVESVAWASERRDVLSGFFFLLAVLGYVRMQDGARARWFVLSLVAFLLSLLSKAWGITLPVVLLALDWYPLRRRLRGRMLLEKVPYALIALAFGVLAFRARSLRSTCSSCSSTRLARATCWRSPACSP